MLPIYNRQGIVVSETPLMHTGLQKVVDSHIERMGLVHFTDVKNIGNSELMRASVVIAELGGDEQKLARECDIYYSLISRFREIHWVFLVPRACFARAVEWLMRPETTLLSTCESTEIIANAIFLGSQKVERISHLLLATKEDGNSDDENTPLLTASEKQVLRLLAKG